MKFNLKDRPTIRDYKVHRKATILWRNIVLDNIAWFEGFKKELRDLSESEGISDVTAVTLIEEILGE